MSRTSTRAARPPEGRSSSPGGGGGVSSILVVGLSHRSAPVALLERTAVTADELVKLLHDVHADHQRHRCHRRLDVQPHRGLRRRGQVPRRGVRRYPSCCRGIPGCPLDELSRHLYVHYEERAVQHIFSVACGLDSMVVGEGQILGQLRPALKLAQANDTVGRTLNEVVQQALRVGKRARNETGIDRAGASLVSVGLSRAGSLEGRRALVVGAGSMSALAVATLARAGRRRGRHRQPHLRAGRAPGPFGRGPGARDRARRPAAARWPRPTSSSPAPARPGLVITPDMIADAGASCWTWRCPTTSTRPYASCRASPSSAWTTCATPATRTADGRQSRRYAGSSATRCRRSSSAPVAATVAPTVVALRSKAAEVVDSELGRLGGRLPELDDRARDEIAQTVRRVVDKLLHAPTVRVKELRRLAGRRHLRRGAAGAVRPRPEGARGRDPGGGRRV